MYARPSASCDGFLIVVVTGCVLNTPLVGSNRLSGGTLRKAAIGVPAGIVIAPMLRSAGTTRLVDTWVKVAVPE